MVYVAIGLLVGFGLGFLPLPFGVTIILAPALAFAIIYVAPRLDVRYVSPTKVHRAMLALPPAPPPEGAPLESFTLLEQMDAAARAADWRALRALLAEDFAMVDATGRRSGAKLYVCTCQNMQRMYPDLRQRTEQILADPYDPDVVYVRSYTAGSPRRGPALEMTMWTRFQLAPGQRQVREIAPAGVVHVA